MAKKYYAVKEGKITGVFDNWDDCKNSVDGYPGAKYKGFATREEAENFLGGTAVTTKQKDAGTKEKDCEVPEPGTLLAYVDGSYEDSIKTYAFGCVFILPNGEIYTEYGNGTNEESAKLRNVTGEMLGAMYAVKTAMLNGYQRIEIRYDYQGIECWATGTWKTKTDLTTKYALAMRDWMRSIDIQFTKVPAHSNVKYNELADQTAKDGIVNGNGVPKVKKIDEMVKYGEC